MQGTHITCLLILMLVVTACGRDHHPPTLSDPPETPTSTTAAAISESGAAAVTQEPMSSATPSLGLRTQVLEAMLKPLWFGWYSAVAGGDAAALGDTVARTAIHDDGVAAIGKAVPAFNQSPSQEAYSFEVLDVLRDDEECVVVVIREDPSAFLIGGRAIERIGVFWPHAGRWYLATSWTIGTPEFAWEDDCELMVREFA